MYGIDDGTQLLKLASLMSLATDIRTPAALVGPFDLGSIQCCWSGVSPSLLLPAKLHVECSIDGINFCDVYPDAYTKKIGVASGCLMYSLETIGYKYVRVFHEVRSNSAGTLDAYLFLKRRRANNP
jgi:hypothetical protein